MRGIKVNGEKKISADKLDIAWFVNYVKQKFFQRVFVLTNRGEFPSIEDNLEDGAIVGFEEDDEPLEDTYDDKLDTTSINAVQNKVITKAINDLEIKYKDINVGNMTANTWYSYDFEHDADMSGHVFVNAIFVAYAVNNFGITQTGFNRTTGLIWYGSSLTTNGTNILRVWYK